MIKNIISKNIIFKMINKQRIIKIKLEIKLIIQKYIRIEVLIKINYIKIVLKD